MGLRTRLHAIWRTVAGGRKPDVEPDRELAAYVDLLAERRIAAGTAPEEARRAVLRDLGSLESVKERVREVRMGRLIDETVRDVAYAWRGLRKAPGFTAAALATLT